RPVQRRLPQVRFVVSMRIGRSFRIFSWCPRPFGLYRHFQRRPERVRYFFLRRLMKCNLSRLRLCSTVLDCLLLVVVGSPLLVLAHRGISSRLAECRKRGSCPCQLLLHGCRSRRPRPYCGWRGVLLFRAPWFG